jgi:hypothetical protein
MRQWMSRVLTLLLLVPVMALASVDSAWAGECRWENVLITDPFGGAVTYERRMVDCAAGVEPGALPAGGSSAPSCDIASASPATFCWGSNPCYYKESVVPFDHPATPPPTPDAAWRVRYCLESDQSGISAWVPLALWMGQEAPPPSMVDQALEATGRIELPSSVLSFNPTARTLVNLDTWFWAEGLEVRELRGTGAFGLVAVAAPAGLEITPGDGSPMRTCPWAIAKSDRCAYAYQHSSVGGSVLGLDGRAAYQASGRAVWTLRFELDGAPVLIDGAQTRLPGRLMNAPVVVAEVQTLVTGTG